MFGLEPHDIFLSPHTHHASFLTFPTRCGCDRHSIWGRRSLISPPKLFQCIQLRCHVTTLPNFEIENLYGRLIRAQADNGKLPWKQNAKSRAHNLHRHITEIMATTTLDQYNFRQQRRRSPDLKDPVIKQEIKPQVTQQQQQGMLYPIFPYSCNDLASCVFALQITVRRRMTFRHSKLLTWTTHMAQL